jgi:CheY-like chemotaxis protein
VSRSQEAPADRVINILVAEDNRADVYLIREAITAANMSVTVQVVRDGEQATDAFDATDRDDSLPCPDLVILDINLPKKSGTEVLNRMVRVDDAARQWSLSFPPQIPRTTALRSRS